jgi:hypothetical protein
MGILADRLQQLIDEMKRHDEELNREIQQHITACHQLINELNAIDKE